MPHTQFATIKEAKAVIEALVKCGLASAYFVNENTNYYEIVWTEKGKKLVHDYRQLVEVTFADQDGISGGYEVINEILSSGKYESP
jgi:hypothetical protein